MIRITWEESRTFLRKARGTPAITETKIGVAPASSFEVYPKYTHYLSLLGTLHWYPEATTGIFILLLVLGIILLVIWNLSRREIPGLRCGPTEGCPEGYVCSSGRCHPRGTCQSNGDCNRGDLCINGRCQECSTDQECPVGSMCSGGRCSILPCQNQDQCPNNFTCQINPGQMLGRCQPNICQTSSDCPTSQICHEGMCLSTGQVCQSNRECHSGTLQCVNGRCQGCRNDQDCRDGSPCLNGVCQEKNSGCPSNSSCEKQEKEEETSRYEHIGAIPRWEWLSRITTQDE